MNLITEWKAVLKKAWSMKAAFALAALGGAQAALPYFGGFISPTLLGSTTMLVALAIVALRVLDQNLTAVVDADPMTVTLPSSVVTPPAPEKTP